MAVTLRPAVGHEAPHATQPGEWDHMHMVLAAWKARSLLTEALTHLRAARPVPADLHPAFADEFQAAIDATAATIDRLRTVTAVKSDDVFDPSRSALER